MPKKTRKKAIKEVKEKIDDSAVKNIKRTYLIGLGRRKASVARVRYYKKGENEILINNKQYQQYFPYFEFQNIVRQPIEKIGFKELGQFNIRVAGGGKRGQAESIRLGIARVLIQIDKSWRKILKAEGYLKRDPREKERKKPGLKRARRAPQWQKR
ncbi:MAG: 30S ribosomal protein S9 [Patescibacteria group bacterium]